MAGKGTLKVGGGRDGMTHSNSTGDAEKGIRKSPPRSNRRSEVKESEVLTFYKVIVMTHQLYKGHNQVNLD